MQFPGFPSIRSNINEVLDGFSRRVARLLVLCARERKENWRKGSFVIFLDGRIGFR